MTQQQIIIGLSGKKQSGKDTIVRYLYQWFQNKYINEECKIYSFADALKSKICIDVMGLTYEQCYGTDKQKNSLTHYKWDNLPDIIKIPYSSTRGTGDIISVKKGFMTAREIMQVVGTNIFRQYFDDSIWISATFKQIKHDNCKFSLISDVRFPGEVDSIINNKGYIFRLLRNVCPLDSHESETALDKYDWISHHRIFEIDNQNMSIEKQNEEITDLIEKIMEIEDR